MVALVEPAVLGQTIPRIWTRPLMSGPPGPCGCGCALTRESSYGFDVLNFASQWLGIELDPWQRWLVIHAGELLPDERTDEELERKVRRIPRFRRVLALVARQNGKTELLRILTLYWMFVEKFEHTLGTSTKLGSARKVWEATLKRARETPALEKRIGPVRATNGQEEFSTVNGCYYDIAAANRKGGRGDTVDRLIVDELREQHTYEAYNAIEPTIAAVPHAQVFFISNQGEDASIVLNDLREGAIAGEDERLGIFEWSAPDGMEVDDPEALAMANPSLGLGRVDLGDLISKARRAKMIGGELLTGFKTEYLCQRVALLDPAIDLDAWEACRQSQGLDPYRDRVAVCIDVSRDEQHATMYAAALLDDDDRVRVDVVQAWAGRNAVSELRAAMPALVEQVQPKAVGWFPDGPVAVIAADLKETDDWPPPGIDAVPIRSAEVNAVCMGFSERVRYGALEHLGEPLLDAHVRAAMKVERGDGWCFGRKSAAPVDAVYAAAGAVHLARVVQETAGLLL